MTTWDARLRELRSPTGEIVTEAQDDKANRYLKRNAVHAGGVLHPDVPWGHASLATQTYKLDPIPGCKETRQVLVEMRYDADDHLQSITYTCDCQRADQGRTCSHAIAVHRHRTKPPESTDDRIALDAVSHAGAQ